MESESLELRLATSLCFETIVMETNEGARSVPVTHYSQDPSIRLKEYASVALTILVSEQEDPEAYLQETLQFLVPYALSPEPSIRYKAIWGLGDVIRMCSNEKCNRWLPILNELLWNFVREMVQDASTEVQEEGLRFLEAMVRCNIGIQAAIDWSNGELLPLIAQKIDTPKSHHRRRHHPHSIKRCVTQAQSHDGDNTGFEHRLFCGAFRSRASDSSDGIGCAAPSAGMFGGALSGGCQESGHPLRY